MLIAQALQLKKGQKVRCPEDRGTPAHTGEVISVGTEVNKTPNGVEYVWVEVKVGSIAVWPSNRLS